MRAIFLVLSTMEKSMLHKREGLDPERNMQVQHIRGKHLSKGDLQDHSYFHFIFAMLFVVFICGVQVDIGLRRQARIRVNHHLGTIVGFYSGGKASGNS